MTRKTAMRCVAGEEAGRGRAPGAVLQVRVRVLRGAGRGRGGRGGPLARRPGRQVRARAVPAAGRGAARRGHARAQGAVRAMGGRGAGAVDGGGRAAAVAAALRGRHGRVRRGARGLPGRLRLRARVVARGAGPVRRHGRLPGERVAARRAARAGAGLRLAARHHDLVRRRQEPESCRGLPAVLRVGRVPGVQSVRRSGSLQAGAGDVDLLPGAAGHRAQRAGGERVRALSVLVPG